MESYQGLGVVKAVRDSEVVLRVIERAAPEVQAQEGDGQRAGSLGRQRNWSMQ